jgi:hypothetical protein
MPIWPRPRAPTTVRGPAVVSESQQKLALELLRQANAQLRDSLFVLRGRASYRSGAGALGSPRHPLQPRAGAGEPRPAGRDVPGARSRPWPTATRRSIPTSTTALVGYKTLVEKQLTSGRVRDRRSPTRCVFDGKEVSAGPAPGRRWCAPANHGAGRARARLRADPAQPQARRRREVEPGAQAVHRRRADPLQAALPGLDAVRGGRGQGRRCWRPGPSCTARPSAASPTTTRPSGCAR